DGMAFMRREFRNRRVVLAVQLNRRAQHYRVGTGGGADAVIMLLHPGDNMPVIETEQRLHPHRDVTLVTANDAHDFHALSTSGAWHEIDDRGDAVIRGEFGFEHHRVIAVFS